MAKNKRPLRIGVDIRDLRVAKTGQKTVTEELCKQFKASSDPDISFYFFDSNASIYSGKKKWRILIGHIKYHWWKQVTLPIKVWRNKCDILFCGDYFVPLFPIGFKNVEIFYDAFFFEYPEHYNSTFLKLFHGIAMPGARRCAALITITEYSKRKLHELAGFPLDKIVTVYPSFKTLPPSIKPMASPVAPGRKYILHVGVMEKRKNLPALIKAFKLLTEKGYDEWDLVLVGQPSGKIYSEDAGNVDRAIHENGLAHRVIRTGYLPDEAVGEMYRQASLYVFPSINEGFGIPILEAFRFNIPVIVANNSCLPEVGGDAVLSFNPFDPSDICDKMQHVIDDESTRNKLIERGRERLTHFEWKHAADKVINVFRSVSRRK